MVKKKKKIGRFGPFCDTRMSLGRGRTQMNETLFIICFFTLMELWSMSAAALVQGQLSH